MNQKHLWIATLIITLGIGTAFLLSVPHTTRDVTPTSETLVSTELPLVAFRDSVRQGLHTISGWYLGPTACTTVTATSTLVHDLDAGRIVVMLSAPLDTQVCLRVPTKIQFSTTLAAPAALPVSIVVNGIAASTTDL